MNELSDEDVIEAMYAEFDRLPLPDSLTARLDHRSTVDRVPDPDTPTAVADPPLRARRRRRVVSIGLIAAAVAAILVGTVIARSGSRDPSASIRTATADETTTAQTTERTSTSTHSDTAAQPSTVVPTVPHVNIPIWLGGFCGRPWPYPAATAPLLVEPAWPNAIRKGSNNIPLIHYRVTNIGTAPIDTSEDYGVMILRGSTVVGFSGHYTLDARSVTLGVGESTNGTSSIPINLRSCEGRQLEAGTYRLIIAEIVGSSRVAFSTPGDVRIIDR